MRYEIIWESEYASIMCLYNYLFVDKIYFCAPNDNNKWANGRIVIHIFISNLRSAKSNNSIGIFMVFIVLQ